MTIKKLLGKPSSDKPRRRIKTSHFLTGALLFILLFSLLMISSASMSSRETVVTDVISTTGKQFIFIVLGFISYRWAIKNFNFELVMNYLVPVLLIEEGLLLSTRLFHAVGGAYGWIRIPGIGVTIQPSEFAKVLIIFTVCIFLCDIKSKKFKKGWDLVKIPAAILIVYAGTIIVLQSDFGSGFALIAIGTICFMIPSNKLFKPYQIVLFIIVFVVIGATVLLMSPHFKNFITSDAMQTYMRQSSIFSKIAYQFYRFVSAGDPLWDRFGYSQELLNALLGMSRGKLTGVGLGNSIQKYGYLASADADYIFPVIVEELGIIGIACVFIPYAIIITTLIYYSLKAKTEKEKVVLIGTVSYLFIHIFLNIGGVSAFIPLTGVPLVLVSRGGTSLLCVMALLGCCQNIISKYKVK